MDPKACSGGAHEETKRGLRGHCHVDSPHAEQKTKKSLLYSAGKLKATQAISSGLQSSLSLGLCIFAMEMPTRTWARAKEHAGPALRCKPC
jgi:hypothetical protein